MTYSPEYLQPLSCALGSVIIEWNRLEHLLVGIGDRLLSCHDHTRIGDPSHRNYREMLKLTVKKRIKKIRELAAGLDLFPGFEEELEGLLKIVEAYEIERHKYVHSLWNCDVGLPVRVDFGADFSKRVAVDEKVLYQEAKRFITIEEVAQFGKELADFYTTLGTFEGRISLSELYTA